MGRHFEHGLVLFEMRRYRDAIAAFTRDIEEEEASEMALAMRAAAQINLNQTSQSRTDISAALQLEPDFAFAYYLLSVVELNCGRMDRARKAITESLRLEHSAVAFNQLATIEFQSHRFRECLAATAESLAIEPNYEPSLILRAKALAQSGDIEESRNLLRQALLIAAENPAAHRELGVLALQAGRRHEALGHLLEARRIDPIEHNDRLSLASAYGSFFSPFRQLNWLLDWLRGWSMLRRWSVIVGASTVVIVLFLVTKSNEIRYSLPMVGAIVVIANTVTLFATFDKLAKVTAIVALRRELDIRWLHYLIGSGEIYTALTAHAFATLLGVTLGVLSPLTFLALSLVILGWDASHMIVATPWFVAIILAPLVFVAFVVLAASGAIWMPEHPSWVLKILAIEIVISVALLWIRTVLKRRSVVSTDFKLQ